MGSIIGTVVDANTKQPLGFATVFIAQTTYGTNAAENGTFKLAALPAGSHELVVSFLGYESVSHAVTLQPGQQLSFRFELSPKANALQEVVVRVDPDWKGNYETFFQNFIGRSPNAAATEIVNANALHFKFDAQESTLTAEADEELVIENKALGYRLYFGLKAFEMSFKDKRVFHAGYPRFVEMKPRSKAQQKRWAAARLKAYRGSMMHFGRALYAQNLEAEGFNVRKLRRIPNPNRPPEQEIQAGIRRARAQSKGMVVTYVKPGRPEDSLSYWLRMSRLDKQVAQLFTGAIPYDQLIRKDTSTGQTRLQFTDFLNVVYTKEREEAGFLSQNTFGARRTPTWQTSLLTLLEPYTFLEPTGMILNPYSHLIEGYWGWEKLAEMLPLDYTPTAK
ncbi:carboxypeptidase-like regulatory domain-containing protein [Rufibacter radiotolerans]|nr:carboxypeptidase-like regulatory domain-containing protein [Rufibacter radiotolerans]